MTDLRITLEDAKRVAEEVVRGKEDYVYVNPDGKKATSIVTLCSNWDIARDQPSCVAGTILYKLGVPKEELIENNTSSVDSFAEYFDDAVAYPPAMDFLSMLQQHQDIGVPWGEALELAKTHLEEKERSEG